MNELAVQRHLRNGGILAELTEKFSIAVKPHPKYPSLRLLKYNQVDSPFAEQIVRECRGLILDADDNWSAVSLFSKKFFNHGEQLAAPIDWSTATVQEKLDGSLMTMYFYDGTWQVASSGTPDAGGNVGLGDMLFRDLFWKTFNAQGLGLPEEAWAETLAWSFEMTTPFNRVVVPHKESRLTLIGVRDMATMQEEPVEKYADMFPVVRSFDLSSFEGIAETFATLSPLQQEGYVVRDAAFNRVKVKHPGYVAIHHLKDGMGTRRILEIVRQAETPEFLATFPEWQEEFDKVRAKFDAFAGEIEADYATLTHIPAGAAHQKEFALLAVKSRCSGALFQLRGGRVATVRQFLATMSITNLMQMLGLKNVEVAE